MSVLLAIAFIVAGGICLTRPMILVAWLANRAARSQGKKAPSPDELDIPGLLLFMRAVGFIILLSGVVMLFIATVPVGPA